MTTQMTQVLGIRPEALPVMSILGELNRTRLYDTFATSELASEPHGVPSAPHKPNPRPSPNPPCHCKVRRTSKGVGSITRSASVEPALCSFPKLSDSGNNGWTEENMARLEKELGLVLEVEQVKSPFASAPTSPSPRSVEAPRDEIQSRERSETTGSRPEEL